MQNEFFVGSRGPIGEEGQMINILSFRKELTREQALNLAAWIVAIADPGGTEFACILEEVTSC